MRDVSGLRIANFVHAFDGRTMGSVAACLTETLRGHGVESRIVACSVTPGIPLADEVFQLGAGYSKTSMAIPSLVRLFRKKGFDAVICHENGPNRAAIVARLVGGHVPHLVVVEHTHFSTFGRTLPRTKRRVTRALYPFADAIVGVSPGIASDLCELFPRLKGKLGVIPAPLTRWHELESMAREPPDHPWFSGETPIVTNVARITALKDQATLIRALSHLNRSRPDDPVRLILIGSSNDSAYASSLRRLIEELELESFVDLVGFQRNPIKFIARSDAFVLSSVSEGSPIVLLEALACGVPVVSTDCPSGPAWLLEGGRCGLLVPMCDPEAMARAMQRVLDDRALRDRLVTRGRSRIQRFAPERVAQDYLKLIAGQP